MVKVSSASSTPFIAPGRKHRSLIPVTVAAGASGAITAVKEGNLAVVVDVIDMSTTLECALEAGAKAVYGASPANFSLPFPFSLCPEKMGFYAGAFAHQAKAGLVIVAEPRGGSSKEREKWAAPVIKGATRAGAVVTGVVPNLGRETLRFVDFAGQVVVAVTAAGGVAYEAAFLSGGVVLTGTVARTLNLKGPAPAHRAAQRAFELACKLGCGITVVAASPNAWEDVLGAHCIAQFLYALTEA